MTDDPFTSADLGDAEGWPSHIVQISEAELDALRERLAHAPRPLQMAGARRARKASRDDVERQGTP
jgi:hypothetical protein